MEVRLPTDYISLDLELTLSFIVEQWKMQKYINVRRGRRTLIPLIGVTQLSGLNRLLIHHGAYWVVLSVILALFFGFKLIHLKPLH